jgi:stage V sporulation protein AD
MQIQQTLRGHTIYFNNCPKIIATGTIAGPKECAGVVGGFVDTALSDDMFGESTFEKAECKMLSYAIDTAITNAKLQRQQIDALFSGDLLNQIISASFAARDFDIPFLGLYSACSTMSESIMLASALVNAGYINTAVAATGSHFASAERQYRYPLEQGTTRPPQSQWTVTGAGGCVIAKTGDGVKVVNATMGKVVDYGVTDVNNMGAAMAPVSAIITP